MPRSFYEWDKPGLNVFPLIRIFCKRVSQKNQRVQGASMKCSENKGLNTLKTDEAQQTPVKPPPNASSKRSCRSIRHPEQRYQGPRGSEPRGPAVGIHGQNRTLSRPIPNFSADSRNDSLGLVWCRTRPIYLGLGILVLPRLSSTMSCRSHIENYFAEHNHMTRMPSR